VHYKNLTGVSVMYELDPDLDDMTGNYEGQAEALRRHLIETPEERIVRVIKSGLSNLALKVTGIFKR
jgi:hypothetical protein